MLEQLLALDVFHLGLVFARMSGAFIALPGFASTHVAVRLRVFIALGVSMALLPIVVDTLPPMPATGGGIVRLMIIEITIGAFLGLVAQTLLSALHFAGSVIGVTSGLANAMVFDPITESQGALVIGFLNMLAMTLIFVTGTHILMLQAVGESYTLFAPGAPLPIGDMSDYLARVLGQSFVIGLRLSSPFIVFSLVFQTAMGVTARLMPQMNVFFVGLPAQILLALALLMLVLPSMMLWAMNHYENGLRAFIAGG